MSTFRVIQDEVRRPSCILTLHTRYCIGMVAVPDGLGLFSSPQNIKSGMRAHISSGLLYTPQLRPCLVLHPKKFTYLIESLDTSMEH
jgi:hypothetical protein